MTVMPYQNIPGKCGGREDIDLKIQIRIVNLTYFYITRYLIVVYLTTLSVAQIIWRRIIHE
jgi:hypothetical protein